MDVCNHQESKRKWVTKQQKTWCSQLVSKLNFHFHRCFEEVAGNVETMGPKLLPNVERRHGWFSEDEKPLLCTQHAGFCRWVKWCSSVQDPPRDGVGGPPALDGPDVGAEDGLRLVPFVFEGFIVVSFSCFEIRATTTNVGFRLLHAVRHSLNHRGLVDQVAVEAIALQGAGAGLPS